MSAALAPALPPEVSAFAELLGRTFWAPQAVDDTRTPAQWRGLILELERIMFAIPGHLTAADFRTVHHFAPGVYMREITIPKGTTVVGEIHKTEHLNILSQGDLSVLTETGVKRLRASTVVLSQPGIKRVGFAHEDSVWITVHHNPDDARDVDAIKDRLVVKSFAELAGPAETPTLRVQSTEGESKCP